ncbi:MAG TPA: hypothetical protein VN578_06530 [Candidatus Binatia bacterium]|nr:hypothetical protein [Candidatus Binatia bacterium]
MAKLRRSRLGKETQRLTTVAASEDSSTDTRVNEFCRALAQHLGQNCQFTKQMWLLSELRVPQLRAIAAKEAAAADVVIVSVHHAESLPPEVQAWIDLWLNLKSNRHRILLALFDPVYQGVSSSMQAYLKNVAEGAQMEFLVQSDDTPSDR